MRQRRSKRGQYGRRALSFLLCAGMLAGSVQGAAVRVDAAGSDQAIYLESSRIPADKLPEGDFIYFGTASAAVEEKGEYAVKLYREGNLDKKASVDLHTIDLMAVYGEDYQLAMDNVKEVGNGRSIMENYVKGQEITHTEDLEVTQAAKEAQGDAAQKQQEAEVSMQQEAEASMQQKAEVSMQQEAEASMQREDDSAGLAAMASPLAREKESQTGEKTRELAGIEDQGLMDEILGEVVAESMQQLEYSSESTVTFEKGEREKVVKFQILEDDKSEGMEGFSLLLVNPQEAELYEVTSLSVSIQDAQEAEHSKVSFTEAAYTSEEGKAVVTVQRTGAEYSVCEMALRTSGVSAVAGTNYEEKNELVSFAPYEMEKEIAVDVAGTGTFQVMLTDLRACEEGAYTEAVVEIDESQGSSLAAEESAVRAAAAGPSFEIEIKGHKYIVEYTEGDATGRIMDNDYEPAVEAGTYYFAADAAHGGMFEYGFVGGNKPNACGDRASDYQSGGKYGRLRYYNSTLGKPGWVYCRIENMPGVYYSYFIPDWDTSGSTDGGQRKIEVPGVDTVYSHGSTKGRMQDQNAVKNLENGRLTANIYAYDDDGKMRKSYVKLYGLCAMNRKFNISMDSVEPLTFRTGEEGSSVTAPSMQVEVDCGAQPKDANIDTRDIYANQDPEKSNLVFSVEDTYVNGHSGIFGHIEGYQITIDPGKGSEAIRKLNYPEDFEKWLQEATIPKPSPRSSSADARAAVTVMSDSSVLTQSEVKAEIKKIRANLDTVPYDKYFLRWIGEMQGGVTASDPLSYGYKQNLKFKPILAHNDITVEVLPSTGGNGHFKDSQLSQNGVYTFHEGDTITLDAVAEDADKYEVTGYEFSTDGEHFDKITSTRQLFLDGSMGKDYYRIRPVIQEKSNAIEIHMDSSAEAHLEIQGLIPQSELEKLGTEYNYLKGRYFLNVNPQGKTALEKMAPVSGKEYMIRILEKEGGKGKTAYRPTIKKKSGNTTYTTQLFQFVAESDAKDNLYEIGVSEVARDELKKYAVSGNLTSSFMPIRDNGTNPQPLPVAGYTLSIGKGTQDLDADNKPYVESVSSVSDATGYYELEGIMGVAGDVIPVFASNGVTNGQIIDVKLSDTNEDKEKGIYTVSQGNVDIGYPSHAPRVTSIDYTYDNPSHVQSNGGVKPNSVNIYDDIFTVSATVDTYGRNVKEAVFTVYTVAGRTTEYRAMEDPDNKNHFVCKIPGMADSFFNGDRIKVRLVDSEKMYSAAGKDWDGKDILNNEGEPVTGIDWNIEYPDVDTGLVFYVENVLTQPKYYDVKDDSISADIPLLGKATSSTQSGLLTFGKNRWADGNGYTLQIGANFTMGNTGQPSGMDKAGMYDNFMNAVRSDKANAEEIILGKEEGSTKEGETDLKAEKKEVENKIKDMKADSTSKAKGAVAKMNEKEPMWQVSDAVVLVFDFLYNPEIGDFQFISGGVAVGGTVTFNMTAYTLVASVPAFLNFSATLQADLTVAYSTGAGRAAMTAGDFDNYSGNLAERLSSEAKATQSVMASGKIQVGVGLCGVLSARGYVSLKIQLDINMGDLGANDKRGGFLIGSAGGIGFDLLFISVNMDFYSVTKGWGSLENRTSYSFFGGLLDESDLGMENGRQAAQVFSLNKGNTGTMAEQAFSWNENGDKILKTYSEHERLVEHEYDMGTSDMSDFGRSSMLRATPGLVRVSTLLDGAAEHTRPQIIALDDNGRQMIVFIGSRGKGEESNRAALYYAVYDGQSWSMPKFVADDGTVDTTPSVIRGMGADGKEKVMVVWADADREFTAEDSTVSKLNALGISAAVYDIESNTMGEEIVMVEDKYCNLSPKLQVADGILYCSYMKRDLSQVQEEEELLDFGGVYSTMSYMAYDLQNREFISGNAENREELLNIRHSLLSDPLVMDYQAVTAKLDGDTYMLSAYTVDGDTNFETKGDRELYLNIYNITKNQEYFPIQVTNDALSQSSPKLTDIDGTVYLTWLEEGYLFQMADATEILEALFGTSTEKIEISASESDSGQAVSVSIDKDVYRNGYIPSGTDNQEARAYKDWYKKSATDLGITDTEYYDGSVYQDLADGTVQTDCANFSQREGMQTSVSNYTLTSNGKDIYVFFTDFGTKDEKSAGVELYGVCYRRWLGDGTGASGSADAAAEGDSIDLAQDWGFGKAVQITDNGKVIDELSLYMDRESNISAVSNYYEQYINENGGMSYSANKLVEIEFETMGSIEVDEGYIKLPDTLASGEVGRIEFDVVNNGLLTSEGFQYRVYQVKDGAQTLVDSGEEETVLGSGETQKVTAFWDIPQELADTQIMVEVQEMGVAHQTVNSAAVDVPYNSNLEFTDTQVLWNAAQPYLAVTVKNTGNAVAKEYQAAFGICGEDGKMGKVYGTAAIPALASGEEKSFELPFEPAIDDFADNMGVIRLRFAISDGTKTVAETNTKLTSLSPICAQINDGKEIALGYGKTAALEVKAAPWNGIAGEVRFYSSDADIASVDGKGTVTGTGNGKAKIYAYYPASGVTADIDVTVTGQPNTDKPNTDKPNTDKPNTDKPNTDVKVKAGTSKIALKKASAVIAPGKSATIGFTPQKDKMAQQSEKVTVSVSGKSVVSKAVITGSKVKITAAKKAVRGNSTTVVLKSKNAAGKAVSSKIKVTIQNPAKKITAKTGTTKKKPISVKKGKKVNVVLNVTAQNKKKATTDTVKVSSKIVKLEKCSVKKGKITLTLKGKKKDSKAVTIKVGKKSVKIYMKVK